MNYPTFNNVKDPILRTWNRLNIIYNIKEHVGNGVAVKYSSQFNKKDKASLLSMAAKVANNGYENTRREIIRNNNS